MIAKVITHGPTRDIALSKLTQGLARTEVAGTVTNLGFLHALTMHSGFAQGDVDTGLIARDLDQLTRQPDLRAQDLAQAALCLAAPQTGEITGFTLWRPLTQTVTVLVQDETYDVHITFEGRGRADIHTALGAVSAVQCGNTWQVPGATGPVHLAGDTVTVMGPNARVFSRFDPLTSNFDAGANSDVIEAPMPGLVRDVFVSPGDTVTLETRLAILEAMKMEHSLLAPREGIVAEVLAAPGDQVEAGAALIRLEPAPDTQKEAAS